MARDHYSVSQRFFHWAVALLVLGNFAGAITADQLGEDSPLAEQIMGLHVSTGMLILILVVARLLTRLFSQVPAPLQSWPAWTRRAAVIGHWALYAMVLLQPVTGYLMVNAHGHDAGFYGLFDFPSLVGKNEGLEEAAEEIHEVLAWVLLLTVLGHAGFALKHHFIDRDETLRRMIRGR